MNEIFNRKEAEVIKSIPLRLTSVKDKIFLGPSSKGIFTKKNFYHVKKSRLRMLGGGLQDAVQQKHIGRQFGT